MKSCTFFGSRNCSSEIIKSLKNKIIELIETENILRFYVGTHGNFDFYTAQILIELEKLYPEIEYYIVLSRLNYSNSIIEKLDFSNKLFPDGIEKVPPKFRIVWRNRYMIKNSDYVIAHITNPFGKSAEFVAEAQRKGKIIIKI